MRSDVDPDVFLSEVFQFRDKRNDLGEAVTDERLTTTTLDALPEEIYYTVKMQSVRDPDLGLEKTIGMMNTIFINLLERSSVPKRSKETYRKVWTSGREPRTDNVRESAMTLTCHNCKKPGHKQKDYKESMGKSDKPSNVESGTTNKRCSCHHSNGHSNKNCYQQQKSGKRWCAYHKSGTHSDDQCYHQKRHGSRNSSTDSKSTKYETFVADSDVTGCYKCSCYGKK